MTGLALLCVTVYTTIEIQGLPIDELIVDAAESSKVFDMMYQEEAGVVNLEMDMLLPLDVWTDIQTKNRSANTRQASDDDTRLWAGGVVPYEIDDSFSIDEVIEVHKAFNQWAVNSCLLFRPSTPQDLHKVIITSGNGCQSYVGRNKEPQFLYLSPKCRKDSIITHELGHTLGLYHEQARPDRDDHVTVVWKNVPAPQSQQFEKFPQSVIRDIGVSYDYLSIMHYGSKAFSMNGDNTIVTSDPKFQDVIGNREILSFRDIKIINILYQCGAKCPGQCPGEGFHDKNCDCLCPGDPIQPCSQGGTEQGAGGQLPLGYVPPTPVTILEECFDSNSDCPRWSSEGRCDTASTYMHMYCRKSCHICKEPCVDRHARCKRWAMLGDCDSNPYYMSNYCKLSCNRCGDGNTTSVNQICEDISANRCPKWRSLGHCGNPVYAEYMKSHCRKTCQMCHVIPEAVKVEEGNAVHQLVTCADHDPNCEKWVKEGQCEVTPEYMYRFCALSCRVCQ